MISEKRIRKPPEVFELKDRRPPQKENQTQKKQKVTSSDYELIPVPQKYEDTDSLFLLYGNIPFMQKDGTLGSNLSMLDQFHLYRGVHTVEYEGQKFVTVKTERRPDKRFPRWKTLVKRLNQEGKKSKGIAKLIKDFSISFETSANEYVNMVTKIYAEKGGKEKVAAMKAEIDQKKRDLFLQFPFINLRSSFRRLQTELDEVVVNDRFLQIIGFTPDTFASAVVSEGLPTLLAVRLEDDADVVQNAKNYSHELNDQNYIRSKTIDFSLYTKSGFVKEAKIQMHTMINFDDTEFKCDFLFAVLDHNYPYILPPIYHGPIFTQSFLNMMFEREKEMERFSTYLGKESVYAKFSNQHKTCKIKQLPILKEEEVEEIIKEEPSIE